MNGSRNVSGSDSVCARASAVSAEVCVVGFDGEAEEGGGGVRSVRRRVSGGCV